MIRLVSNRVAIVPLENPEKIGHIIVPDVAKTRLNQGFVKYRGPEVQDLKVGDYVLFSEYSGTTTYVEGEGKFIILPEDFVVASLGDISSVHNVTIPGLYFRDRHGEYFEANHELAMQYIAQTFSDDPTWRDRIKVKNMEKPKLEDYERLGAPAK